ncbi:MAG: L,D-transpeptidase [Leptolyngbya sp. SIO4C1]|nr:L,D-transpeptidase [Leptolyngbya sp. SIO4C1]
MAAPAGAQAVDYYPQLSFSATKPVAKAPLSAPGSLSDRLSELNSPNALLPAPDPPLPRLAEPAPATQSVAEPVTQPVYLVLRLDQRQVHVYRSGRIEASYPVAVGKTGWETPTGSFEVFHRLVDPGWTHPMTGEVVPPGPENPLGERWIAFWTDGVNQIGFHGTPNRESVGQAASHGCVRMYNEDIRELYELIEVGTRVMVL